MKRIIIISLFTLLCIGVRAQDNVVVDNGGKSKVQYNLYVGGSYMFDFPVELGNGDMLYMRVGAPVVEFDVASRLNKRVSVGGELSIMLPLNPYAFMPYLPIFTFNIAPNVKVYFPTRNQKITPFINFAVGAHSAWGMDWGLYTNAGVGIDIKRFSIMAGYRGALAKYMSINMDKMNQGNSIYLQLGVRW